MWEHPDHFRLDDMGCWAHDCHSAIGHALKLFRSVTSGCISFSLMQRQRGVQECLRHCIADELRARAIAQVGMLPPDNSHELTQNRNRVLEVLQIPEVRNIRLQAFFRGTSGLRGLTCTCLQTLRTSTRHSMFGVWPQVGHCILRPSKFSRLSDGARTLSQSTNRHFC